MYWLRLVFSVPFRALTLMVRWQEVCLDCRNPQRFSSGTGGGGSGRFVGKKHLFNMRTEYGLE